MRISSTLATGLLSPASDCSAAGPVAAAAGSPADAVDVAAEVAPVVAAPCFPVPGPSPEVVAAAGRRNAPTHGWVRGRRFQTCYFSPDTRYTNSGDVRVYTVRFSPRRTASQQVSVLNDRGCIRTLAIERMYNFQWLS